jgi:outer membrane protein OmpA-like peptidoglycan-associated protein
MRMGMPLGILVAVLAISGAGCAGVEWTEQMFAKRQVEVDERFVKVETGVQEQGARIDRVEVQVAKIDSRLTETQDLVRGTGGTVSQPPSPSPAPARTTVPEGRVARALPERMPRSSTRTLIGVFHVPFGFDSADIEPRAETALDAILKELRQNPSLTLDLEGSTDPVGHLDYNIRLSQRRVESVRRWLLGHGVERTRIVGSMGRGPLVNASLNEGVKRRVMIKLMSSVE